MIDFEPACRAFNVWFCVLTALKWYSNCPTRILGYHPAPPDERYVMFD